MQDDPEFIKLGAALLNNLAHPERLTIVALLIEKERTVTELAETLKISQQATSLHLSILRTAGVLTRRGVGQLRFYRCTCPKTARLFALLDEVYKLSGNLPPNPA